MEHLSNDCEDHPNQHKNSCKLCDEMGHRIVNLMERQWKLKPEFPNGGKAIVEQILTSEERNKPKRAQDYERKVNHLSKVI